MSALGRVSLRGIVKRFGAFTALDDIDLEIEPAEFFALLGPSGQDRRVDELDDSHLGVIAPSRAYSDDPCVPTGAGGVALREGTKEVCHGCLGFDYPEGLAPGMERAPLSEGDEALGNGPEFFSLCGGRLNPFAGEELRCEVAHEGLTVGARSVEPATGFEVSHERGLTPLQSTGPVAPAHLLRGRHPGPPVSY